MTASPSRPLLILVTTAVVALLPGPSSAQLRSLPAEVKAGEIRQLPGATVVVVDRNELRLAAGAQIRDSENRVALPDSLANGTVVLYVLDSEGLVRRAWIPSDAEAALVPPRRAPRPFVPVN
jgi:hypothetical protein